MQKITKILNILTIVMFVITVVLLGLFYFGGELQPGIHRTINMVVIYPICCCYYCSSNIPDYQIIHQTERSDEELYSSRRDRNPRVNRLFYV